MAKVGYDPDLELFGTDLDVTRNYPDLYRIRNFFMQAGHMSGTIWARNFYRFFLI